MIRRWLALTYYLYALRLAALSHFYFNPLYLGGCILIALNHKKMAFKNGILRINGIN